MAKTSKKGLFISFEGGDGGGKSTQIRELERWLRRQGYSVLVTLEPGGSVLGRRIREVLLDPKVKNMSHRTELLLYQADRAQHVDEVVGPALAAGKIVISDRYADSSTVYQGMCRRLGVAWTEQVNRFATNGLMPDLAIVLDLPESVGIARVRKRLQEDAKLKGRRRAVKLDRLEREKTDFHRRVRRGFLVLAKKYPRRVKVVDASGSVETIHASIRDLVKARL